jgi:lysophospholipase L1-like esterase
MDASPGAPRRPLGMRILVWALALAAGVSLFEWVARPSSGRHAASGLSSGPGPARYLVMREWKRSTDYRFAPLEARKHYREGGLQDVYLLATDAEGFIEPARRHAKPDLSIVFLGGSTTECLYVSPHNRFPHLTATNLERQLGLNVNGINAALSGNNSMHSLLLLLGKVIPLRPDFVVLMHATNDIAALSKGGSYWIRDGSLRIYEQERLTVGDAGKVLVRALIPYTSATLQRAANNLRELVGIRRADAKAPAPVAAKDARAEMGRDFENSLRSFVRLATAWGIAPVLMTQVHIAPTSDAERRDAFVKPEQQAGAPMRPESFPSLLDFFNAITREVAKSEGILLIDLARARNWVPGDVYDGMHFTDQGSKLVADIVATALREQVALRRRSADRGERQ